MNFQIQLNITPDGHNNYGVDSKGSSKLHRAIIEAIKRRTRTNDLGYLLVCLKLMSTLHVMLNMFLRKCWLRIQTLNQDNA